MTPNHTCDRCGKLMKMVTCYSCEGKGYHRELLIFKTQCYACSGKGKVLRCPDEFQHIMEDLHLPKSTQMRPLYRGFQPSTPPASLTSNKPPQPAPRQITNQKAQTFQNTKSPLQLSNKLKTGPQIFRQPPPALPTQIKLKPPVIPPPWHPAYPNPWHPMHPRNPRNQPFNPQNPNSINNPNHPFNINNPNNPASPLHKNPFKK